MRYRPTALALATTAICFSSFGQSLTGTIAGTVTDPAAGAVPGANVAVSNAGTQVTVWRGTTDARGRYSVPGLSAGVYDLKFSLTGFSDFEVKGVSLTVDQRAGVDATLRVSATHESVTVTATHEARIETESSSIEELISTDQVANLPMPNRSIVNLLNLIPGVSAGGDATGLIAKQMSVNGSRTQANEFTVDGVSVMQGATGAIVQLPSTDAVREVRVLTSAYSSEYGRTSGGTVSLIIASGTNRYHGGIYEYFQNEDLNANSFFNNLQGLPRAPDRYNLFGAKIGGPVRIPRLFNGKNSTFFFANFEGLRQDVPAAPIESIPGTAFRVGDFSASPVAVYDPKAKAQFPGNRIPVSRLDPAAVKIMGLLPLPNSIGTPDTADGRAQNNYVGSQSTAPSTNKGTARVDHSIGAPARLYGSLTHYNSASIGAYYLPGPLNNDIGPSLDLGYQVSVGYTQIWTPNLISEARAGLMRDRSTVLPPSNGIDSAAVLGIQSAIGNSTPEINMSGWSGLGNNSNTWRHEINNVFQYSWNVTRVHAGHTLKTGLQLRRNEFNVLDKGCCFAGQYTFSGEMTSKNNATNNPVNTLADFLLGEIQTAVYTLPMPTVGRRNSNFAAFVQDDWKIRRNLTLNLGLRYEYESPATEVHNIYSRVDETTGQLLVAGKNASPSLNLVTSKLNFGPRVGLAYSLNSKTVIRSAVGIFFGNIFSNLGGNVAFPGFSVQQNFAHLGTAVPQPFSLSQGFPLIAVQNLNNPFFVEQQASTSNPLSDAAEFGSVNPVPSITQWNFGFQRELPGRMILDANYVASHGIHLPLILPSNQVPFAAIQAATAADTTVATQLARPYPNDGLLQTVMDAGSSSYQSLQTKLSRNLGGRLVFMAVYTFAKSIDDGSGVFGDGQPNGVVDVGQYPSEFRRLDRAISSFDRPHVFGATLQYMTAGNKWVRGFSLAPVLRARSGLPSTVTQTNLNSAASQQRPDLIDSNEGDYAPQTTSQGTAIRYLLAPGSAGFPYAPTGPMFVGSGAAKQLVLPVSVGTLGRDTVRGPGELNLDLSVGRQFQVRERLRFSVRAEGFNVMNHTNFNNPNTSLSVTANSAGQAVWNSPNFGLITSAKASRFLQMTARIDF